MISGGHKSGWLSNRDGKKFQSLVTTIEREAMRDQVTMNSSKILVFWGGFKKRVFFF